ncbi:MAG: ABC-F family ATP-binding cassette domain-containing protein [Desulfuromonadales bacterium]|nr:ABC-F family ATP-binding cassette domain-containing protein [Desulfuromonadales bacterium]
MVLAFHHLTFTHENALAPLLEDVTAHFSEGWTGVVGANGAGKTTVLHLAAGDLQPEKGTISRPDYIVFCPQRTDDPPIQLPLFLSATEAEAAVLRGKLQIGEEWADRWPTLSHGERKRAQIAVALWQQPDLLLIDEPTNHIDIAARTLLAEALAAFRGIGLLVSHDRELLDLLCRQCLFLDPPQAVMRPGGYTKAAAEARREEDSLRVECQTAQQHLERLSKAAQRRHAEAARADRKKSKRGLARGDSDGRARIDRARVSGKDGQAGRLAHQLSGRLAHAREHVASFQVKKRYAASFWLEGSISPRQRLFTIPADTLALDGSRRLIIPDLTMLHQDRIALTGANGLGKSTLVRHILHRLNVPEERLIYLPQEIDLARTRDIMAAVHRLSPEQLGVVMTVVSALGSRPERLLRHLDVSPGELRKVLLALGIIRRPHLVVMDEPTNHLDLQAIECLEDALRDCPCGLLLVSHDLRFLSRIADTRWHLQQEGAAVTLSTSYLPGNRC